MHHALSSPGSHRSADIMTTEDSVIAVITFQDLEELAQTEPQLQNKLTHMFACE